MEYSIYYLFDKRDDKKTPLYVGQTKDLKKRFLTHISDTHNGLKSHISYHMRMIGISNIDIKEIIRCDACEKDKYEMIALELLNPICNTQRVILSSYPNYAMYKKAWREKNIKTKRYECNICHKCVSDGNRLKEHMKTHNKK